MKERRKDIDFIKGIAIIAVVLYHIGILKSGYLGVDIFLVVNGFFVIPAIYKKIFDKDFNYIKFMIKKYLRLAPLVILICFLCLAIGYIGMLPDDFENLSQSIIASLAFSQNILSAITTNDYWNIVNEYKPLMHLWYVGIIFELYLIVPIIIYFIKFLVKKIKTNSKKTATIVISIFSLISLTLFLLPIFSDGSKFYFVFFRLWEFLLGGLIGLNAENLSNFIKRKTSLKYISLLVIIVLLMIGIFNTNYFTLWSDHVVPIGSKEVYNSNLLISNQLAIILITTFTGLYLVLPKEKIKSKFLETLGNMSYSIFIWHQPILAFYRYFFKYELSIMFIFIYLIIVLIISYLSYRYIEQKLSKKNIFILCLMTTIILGLLSFRIYLKAGVVRDVPELNISKKEAVYKMHAKYVDRIYDYDRDFDNSIDNIKILVIGNSFARDFANILLETDFNDKFELSYIYSLGDSKYKERIKDSDYIFYFGYKNDLDDEFWNCVNDKSKVYGIGTKNFGESNGAIYFNRFKDWYFEQKILLNTKYQELNYELSLEWGDNYINLIDYVKNEDNTINVFSDDNKLISQDCHHLTKEGAKYYARIIDFKKIIKEIK